MGKTPPKVGLEMRQEHADDLALIDGYGDGGFRVKGRRFEGSIVISPQGVWPVEVDDKGEPTDHFLEVLSLEKLDLLLVGRGSALQPLPKEMRLSLEKAALAYDCMDTGAAARTYNVLLIEGRRVAAILKAL